ncbi:hypothetical protein D3C84_1142410 [compost metagenome]
MSEGYDFVNLSFSPITGGDGNIEFLLHLRWEDTEEGGRYLSSKSPSVIVEEAHNQL